MERSDEDKRMTWARFRGNDFSNVTGSDFSNIDTSRDLIIREEDPLDMLCRGRENNDSSMQRSQSVMIDTIIISQDDDIGRHQKSKTQRHLLNRHDSTNKNLFTGPMLRSGSDNHFGGSPHFSYFPERSTPIKQVHFAADASATEVHVANRQSDST